MERLKPFDDCSDDPNEYDKLVFCSVGETYQTLTGRVIVSIRDQRWFGPAVQAVAEKYANWDFTVRHLYASFALSDALGIDPSDMESAWVGVACARILPLVAYDCAMDEGVSTRNIHLASAYLASALLKGQEYFHERKLDTFWVNVRKSILDVIETVSRDLSERNNHKMLKEPNKALSVYGGPQCPTQRSSYLPSIYSALISQMGQVGDPKCLREFEFARQVIDDLADMREDILDGRVTMPTLFVLKSTSIGKRAASIISAEWDQPSDNSEWWYEFRDLALESDMRFKVTDVVERSIDKVRKWTCGLKGNTNCIEALIEAKRAFLYRVFADNLETTHTSLCRDGI